MQSVMEDEIAMLRAEVAAIQRTQMVVVFAPDSTVVVEANENFLQTVSYAREEVR
jgi:hypothetical protein